MAPITSSSSAAGPPRPALAAATAASSYEGDGPGVMITVPSVLVRRTTRTVTLTADEACLSSDKRITIGSAMLSLWAVHTATDVSTGVKLSVYHAGTVQLAHAGTDDDSDKVATLAMVARAATAYVPKSGGVMLNTVVSEAGRWAGGPKTNRWDCPTLAVKEVSLAVIGCTVENASSALRPDTRLMWKRLRCPNWLKRNRTNNGPAVRRVTGMDVTVSFTPATRRSLLVNENEHAVHAGRPAWPHAAVKSTPTVPMPPPDTTNVWLPAGS